MLSHGDILKASVLIVDDTEANVRLLEQMLRSAGYSAVSSTMDPTRVCALHREHSYDLILLDLQMPAMDGFAVLEALKSVQSDSYVPVLAITAEPAHKLRALQAGAKDFVAKPFDLLEIKTRIHNLLEVRLLYRALAEHNQRLETIVQERTAELRASEARFKRLTELSSDWYWEQDANGNFTQASGQALEMLGIGGDSDAGWNDAERSALEALIAARRPFLDLVYSRVNAVDGATQFFQVSGEPIFDPSGRYAGYRGVGMDVTARMLAAQKRRAETQSNT
ncbi:response regulator [Sinimarinibacterium sp. CAU 1509]|uniref:response regulator n=1 Tax=Sinimarinibacterium sp. CAU 1509 TaxID=2562283 RepID=UPI0010AC79BD|nr:response regulator [Sinimarinibacterium sp. CAU 1509]TJY61019.1 response regulator [Sinimarinibacterium sp. CAU 1509]